VVFVRDLAPGRDGDVEFAPGQTVHVAIAVWDGSAGDRNGQKSVTIWHRLELEP
jgi:DMSO reductase family type II enzyme heme b subunit